MLFYLSSHRDCLFVIVLGYAAQIQQVYLLEVSDQKVLSKEEKKKH